MAEPMGTAPPIDRITVHVVSVPRADSNRVTHSYGTTPDPRYALVEVEAGGLVGLGEAPTEIWWTGEDADSVTWAIEAHLAPALLQTSSAVRDAVGRMDGALYGNPYAKAAIQMALWDLLGKRTGLPLHELLGTGTPAGVPVKYGIGWDDVGHLREEVERGRELGFTFFKVKVGQDPRRDLLRVSAAVSSLRDGEQVGIDVNGGWSLAAAIRILPELERLGLAFLEQPVPRDQFAAMAELCRRSSVPVLAHEMVTDHVSALALVRSGITHLWALTPSMHGGVLQTLDLLAIARAHGVPCLLGSTFELGVASAHMLHIAASAEQIMNCSVPSDIPSQIYLRQDVIQERFTFRGGRLYPPDGPGLGVTLDLDVLGAHRA